MDIGTTNLEQLSEHPRTYNKISSAKTSFCCERERSQSMISPGRHKNKEEGKGNSSDMSRIILRQMSLNVRYCVLKLSGKKEKDVKKNRFAFFFQSPQYLRLKWKTYSSRRNSFLPFLPSPFLWACNNDEGGREESV